MVMMIPNLLWAQSSLPGEIQSLQSVLDQLYSEMIPLCSSLIGVSRGIAGFAALWYIASRVWRSLANAEQIDFYPLLRPFALGMCILLFPTVIGVINGVMKPTVTGTAALVDHSDQAIAALLEAKQKAIQQTDTWQMYVGATGEGDRDRWYKYTHPDEDPSGEGWIEGIGNDVRFAMAKASYNFRNSIKEWMSEVLQVLFQAAALCINTLRTFNLIILAILGPLVLGMSVFDGFQHTLRHWLARYINVFLWLPVANIFGAVIGQIQQQMLKIDLSQIQQSGDTFFSATDVGYLIFLIIGILGYFTVPSIASHIVWVGGGDALSGKATALAAGAVGGAVSGGMTAVAAGAAQMGRGAQNVIGTAGHISEGYGQAGSGHSSAAGAGRLYGQGHEYSRNKLSTEDKNS
jgi:conjugative transposon TraJ protein